MSGFDDFEEDMRPKEKPSKEIWEEALKARSSESMGVLETPAPGQVSNVIKANSKTGEPEMSEENQDGKPESQQDALRAAESTISEPIVDESILNDIPVQIIVSVGQTMVPIRDIMRWSMGNIISLDSPVGAPVVVSMGGVILARGDLLKRHNGLAVRLTEVVQPRERLDARQKVI